LLHESLAGAVHHQLALLFDGLEGYEAHLGPGDSLNDGRRIGGVVLAAFAREAVGGDELGGHQTHGVAESGEFPGPVVGAGACFHADQARWQGGDEFQQFVSGHAGAHQDRFASPIHAVNGEDALCQVDSYGYDGHGLPLP
jgi:hypothetical protein